MVRSAAVLGLAAPLTLFLAGCGSGNGGADKNIAEIAQGASELSTLVEALKAANLISVVSGNDKLTVFAPTDDAFAQLGNETLDCLLAPVGVPVLADVLKYHVVHEESKAADLTNNESLTTLDDDKTLTVLLANDTVTVEGTNRAEVVKADIMASNGVVHEVNAVLIPKGFAAPQCGTGSIAATAEANKDLKTLTAALGAANLVDTFDGKTVYTVFAPTDEAFAKLGDDTVQCLLKKENLDALTTVLEYHVVAGYDLSSSIKDGLELETLEKEKLSFSTADGNVTLTTTSGGNATVVAADVFATNGVVHVIDAVLLPKNFTDNNPCGTLKNNTIADVAGNAPELKLLVSALEAADLISAVSGPEKLTVFAPANGAFDQLGQETLSCLLAPVGKSSLAEVLKYHVVPGEAKSTDLANNERLATLDADEKLTVSITKGNVTIEATNNAEVVKADILASNGVVHEVNAVLIPKGFVAPQCGTGSIAATAEANKDLKTLTAALGAANLVDTFDGKTVYTVFAPTDEAFAKLGDDTVQCLLKKENLDALTSVLEYHVVAGYDLSSSIKDGLQLETLEKEKLSFATADGNVTLTTTSGGNATVVAADVFATNGVVHVIDAVLLPKDFIASNPCATIVV